MTTTPRIETLPEGHRIVFDPPQRRAQYPCYGAASDWMYFDTKHWRRIKVTCFSNTQTLFVDIKGVRHIVDTDLPLRK